MSQVGGTQTLVDQKHPYASPGAVIAAVTQFRKMFPTKVTADTLRKLGIAPNNESYVINTLRFVGAIDEDGAQTDKAAAAFNQHDLPAFQKSFGELVKSAYAELFKLRGDDAWQLPLDGLIAFFRNTDQTSDPVGRRQASTFQALASLAGHGEAPWAAKPAKIGKEAKAKVGKAKPTKVITPIATSAADSGALLNGNGQRDVGLTVRIEVNLPPAGDQETYDRIFRSIRENLLNAK